MKKLQRTSDKISGIPHGISREEIREWVLYEPMFDITDTIHFVYFPSAYQHASAFKVLPTRPEDPRAKSVKGPMVHVQKLTDQRAPGTSPLYLQVDSPTYMRLKVALSTVHPRILVQSNIPKKDHLNKCYAVLEEFEWFEDCEVPYPKGFIETRGYDAIEVSLAPGRHFFRLWTFSRLNWHVTVLSDAAVLMGGRDVVLAACNVECPWVSKYLTLLGAAFISWIRNTKPTVTSTSQSLSCERDFFDCYQPDLPWDIKVAGYPKVYIHWMFKKALQNVLKRELTPVDYPSACEVFRRYFRDPDFGLSEKAPVQGSFRALAMIDPCDCVIPEFEEEMLSNETEEDQPPRHEEQVGVTPPRVSILIKEPSSGMNSKIVQKLLTTPESPIQSQICEAAKAPLSCPILKFERQKAIQKHEAATRLQAFWRGHLARSCLKSTVTFSPEILKAVMECTFGNLESLSRLMNELFRLFPGIKHAYSISSGLSGGSMLVQNTSITKVTVGSKWLPFFQGTYFAHMPVKVHFDLTSNIKHTTFAIYDNDTGIQVPQAYNTHMTFHFTPNKCGYTVMGHGTLHHSATTASDAVWTLSVLSSTANVFHICDNEFYCRVGAVTSSDKFRMEEIYLPNRRNIIGGVQLTVTKSDTISFRAACTSSELELEAVLWQIEKEGPPKDIARCQGVGELYWPYVRLEAGEPTWIGRATSKMATASSARSLKTKGRPSSTNLRVHTKSTTRIHKEPTKEVKLYIIEVTAPKGWPLSLEQWKRVEEVRSSTYLEGNKKEKTSPPKKKDDKKSVSVRDKEREKEKSDNMSKFTIFNYSLQPGDAYAELECATPRNGGVLAKKDESRDIALYNAIRSWDHPSDILHGQDDPKITRLTMGATYRKLFREENLEYSPLHPDESILNTGGTAESYEGELERSCSFTASESEFFESHEEDTKYNTMPVILKDRFQEFYFVPLVMKEFREECVLQTSDGAKAARAERQARMLAAINRMEELDAFNEEYVLGRQKRRGRLVETLYVDSILRPELVDTYNERDEIIAKEIIQILSLTRGKGQEEKKLGKGKSKGKPNK